MVWARRLDYPNKLVDEVVREVCKLMPRDPLPVAEHEIDLVCPADEVMQDFKRAGAGPGVRILGLYGMGGIGKSTLARKVFNLMHQGDHMSPGRHSCFVHVGQDAKSSTAPGQEKLVSKQKHLLKEMFDVTSGHGTIEEGRETLKRALGGKDVLLVLDDVWERGQIDALLVEGLGQGSRVVVTTRDRSLVDRGGRDPRWLPPREVQVLGEPAARTLFAWHAFGSSEPPAEHAGISKEVVSACGGLPLTLEVMGGLFAWQNPNTWGDIRHRLTEAEDLGREEEDSKLWGRLQISYDCLKERERGIFLDIVCFMLGKEEHVCSPVWGKGAGYSLDLLKQGSLLKTDDEGRFAVHDQLRDMGRRVASSQKPLSHVWMPASLELVCEVPCTLLTIYLHLCSVQLFSVQSRDGPCLRRPENTLTWTLLHILRACEAIVEIEDPCYSCPPAQP